MAAPCSQAARAGLERATTVTGAAMAPRCILGDIGHFVHGDQVQCQALGIAPACAANAVDVHFSIGRHIHIDHAGQVGNALRCGTSALCALWSKRQMLVKKEHYRRWPRSARREESGKCMRPLEATDIACVLTPRLVPAWLLPPSQSRRCWRRRCSSRCRRRACRTSGRRRGCLA